MFFNGVKVYNNKPRNYIKGGYVKQKRNMTYQQIHHDSINAIVKPNEIVIPIKYTKAVKKFLKSKHIRLPNL